MCSNCAEPTKENEQPVKSSTNPRFFIDERRQRMIDQLAADFDWGTGDVIAVSYAIREVLKRRFEIVLKHGKNAGD